MTEECKKAVNSKLEEVVRVLEGMKKIEKIKFPYNSPIHRERTTRYNLALDESIKEIRKLIK